MSRMEKRIAAVVLLIATFVGAGSIATAASAAPASAGAAFKPDICGDFCR